MINREDGRGLSKFLFGSNFFWLVFGLLLLIVWLSSCSTLENKIEKAKIVAYQNPKSFAEFCGLAYPIKEVVVKGKDSIINDTIVRRDTVTIIRTVNGIRDTIKAACPPCKATTKTIFRTDTVRIENTAKIKGLEVELEAKGVMLAISEDNLLEARKQVKNRLWILIGIGGLMLVYVGLKVKKLIPF